MEMMANRAMVNMRFLGGPGERSFESVSGMPLGFHDPEFYGAAGKSGSGGGTPGTRYTARDAPELIRLMEQQYGNVLTGGRAAQGEWESIKNQLMGAYGRLPPGTAAAATAAPETTAAAPAPGGGGGGGGGGGMLAGIRNYLGPEQWSKLAAQLGPEGVRGLRQFMRFTRNMPQPGRGYDPYADYYGGGGGGWGDPYGGYNPYTSEGYWY